MKSNEQEYYPGHEYQGLFDLMHEQHGLILLVSEMQDIIEEARKIDFRNNEQKAIRLLTELVGFQNGAPLDRHKEEYDKLMNEIYAFLDSQSPAEFDTLQEGNYTEDLSRENFEYLIALEGDSCELEWKEGLGLAVYKYVLVTDDYPLPQEKKTKLTSSEFIRRAENTFKNQKQ